MILSEQPTREIEKSERERDGEFRALASRGAKCRAASGDAAAESSLPCGVERVSVTLPPLSYRTNGGEIFRV